MRVIKKAFFSLCLLFSAFAFAGMVAPSVQAQSPANACTVTTQTHGIQLLWGGPSPGGPAVLTYSVYRSTTTAGPYTKIGSVPVGTGTCLDSTGVVGTTYFYVVTSANADGESGFSNEASAVAPTLTPPVMPNKPGTLRASPK